MIRQLVDIFVPEHSKGNYLLPTTVLGITIEQDTVVGTVLNLNKTAITVQKTVTQSFDDSKGSRQSKITTALTALVKKAGPSNKIVVSLPSSLVMFKELSFPFSDPDKIRMVLRYEVEALLPFPVNEACVDFLITKNYPEQNRSDVIIAAVQKKFVDEHLKPFNEAGIDIANVTVDAIGLYGLYLRQMGQAITGNTALVALEPETSRVIFFTDGQLKHIRTLRQGFASKDTDAVWNSINFTLQSFADENTQDQKIKKVSLFGLTDKEAIDEANAKIAFPCETFSLPKFLAQTEIGLNISKTSLNLMSFMTALPLVNGRFFTLLPNHLTQQEQSRLNRQVITALILSVGTVLLLGVHSFTQIRKLSAELELSQKQVLQTIKKSFPAIKTNSRRDALDFAQREVKKEENIWSSFSAQTRQSFLQYLYDLSTKIDRETLGLNLKKMVISKNVISLEGNVRSFDAVEQFEHQLRETKLFSHIPDMQKIDFSVQLPLDNKGGL